MDDRVIIHFPDGHTEAGDIFISPTEIVFYKRNPMAVHMGGIASVLHRGQESLRLNISGIVRGQKGNYKKVPHAYFITMRSGTTFVLCFYTPRRMIPYLDSLLR